MSGVYYIFETEMGWVAIAGSNGRICRLELPKPDKSEAEEALKAGIRGHFVETMRDFSGCEDSLMAYFAGKRVDFDCDVDADDAGDFDRKVWFAAREIGYGEVQTYAWIASRIGHSGAARAVGRALGRNPIPVIIPCHRVVRSDGGLGGFSSGLRWKVRLLELETCNGRAVVNVLDSRE